MLNVITTEAAPAQRLFNSVEQTCEKFGLSPATVNRILRANPELGRRVLGRRLIHVEKFEEFVLACPTSPRAERKKRAA